VGWSGVLAGDGARVLRRGQGTLRRGVCNAAPGAVCLCVAGRACGSSPHICLPSTDNRYPSVRQVELDAPRTAPSEPFFHQELIQRSLVRILYLWGVRHPASGYVQVLTYQSPLLTALPPSSMAFFSWIAGPGMRVWGSATRKSEDGSRRGCHVGDFQCAVMLMHECCAHELLRL
jgi:hypothetical protein